jgi:hypothetical protein
MRSRRVDLVELASMPDSRLRRTIARTHVPIYGERLPMEELLTECPFRGCCRISGPSYYGGLAALLSQWHSCQVALPMSLLETVEGSTHD